MSYDLIIRGGTIVDGSGLPRYWADVGIKDGLIVKIGEVSGDAAEVIDATGHVVAPGFIDAHTHMDAQIFWDPIGTPSCWHGTTSVVMGNCGFTLAPCAEKDKALVIRNLERSEDISPAAMEAGIEWSWETFPEFLDTIEKLPKGINYASYVGHSALRTYAMGERAFTHEATPEDLNKMKSDLREAIKAGAVGFTTTRSASHKTPDDGPVASRLATWREIQDLVGVMGELKAGIFELTQEDVPEPDQRQDYLDRLKALALDTNVPITFGVVNRRETPDVWRDFYDCVDDTCAEGGKMMVQGKAIIGAVLLSFESTMPFDTAPLWSDFRQQPLADQEAQLRDPKIRAALVKAAQDFTAQFGDPKARVVQLSAEARPPDYDNLRVLDKPLPPYRTIAEIAAETGKDPVDIMIDLALETNMKQFFLQPHTDEDPDVLLAMLRHPRSCVTFSDAGAHVSQIIGASNQTNLLSQWVRDRKALTLEEAVRKITFDIAVFWGIKGRGLLRKGNFADLVIFDPDRIGPEMPKLEYDLPAGAKRLTQKATGIKATIVNGKVLMRDNQHTGIFPGKLLRGLVGAAA